MSWRLTLLLAAFLAVAAEGKKAATYPQPNLLIEAAELAKPAILKRSRILDTRSNEKYKAGHIAHATRVDVGRWNRDFTAGPDKKAWEKRLTGLGINVDTPVVVYGDDLRETARVWWILHYWGIGDVRILNGGWKAWPAAKGKIDKGEYDEPYFPPVGKVKLSPHPNRLAVKTQLLDGLKKKRFQIADARSSQEYCGKATTAKKNGAIPGSKHLEWKDVLDSKTGRFKTPAQLSKLFKTAGLDLKKPTVTYCQSGGRAAVLAFTLELMDAREVRNYYRSWAEWGNASDTPVEKPMSEE